MTPKEQGYYMPAEWAKHEATWLTYPKNPDSWPGKIETIYPSYHLFVKTLAEGEQVHINVDDQSMLQHVKTELEAIEANMSNIFLHLIPSNDAWCRDHGPAFLLNRNDASKRAIVNWNHNAWGGKYPYELDTQVPVRIHELMPEMQLFEPGIVMEGGSIDVNGCGDLLTTTSCLLNPNRNPQLNQDQIEGYLRDYYGVDNIIWPRHRWPRRRPLAFCECRHHNHRRRRGCVGRELRAIAEKPEDAEPLPPGKRQTAHHR